MKDKEDKPEKQERLKPISLYPIEVEEALEDLTKIKPKKKEIESKEKL